jgi:hypothetical protein
MQTNYYFYVEIKKEVKTAGVSFAGDALKVPELYAGKLARTVWGRSYPVR